MAARQPAVDSENKTAREDLGKMTDTDVDRSLETMTSGKILEKPAVRDAGPAPAENKPAAGSTDAREADKAKQEIWREENAALGGKFEDLRARMKSDKPPTEYEKKHFYAALVNQVAREHMEMTPWMLLEGGEAARKGSGSTYDKGVESMTEKLWSGLLHKAKLETFLGGPIDQADAVENLKGKLEVDLRKLAEGHKKILDQKKQLTAKANEPGIRKTEKPEPSAIGQAFIEIGEWNRLTADERKAKARLLNMNEADIDRSVNEMRAGDLQRIPASEISGLTDARIRLAKKERPAESKEPWYKKLFGGKKAA